MQTLLPSRSRSSRVSWRRRFVRVIESVIQECRKNTTPQCRLGSILDYIIQIDWGRRLIDHFVSSIISHNSQCCTPFPRRTEHDNDSYDKRSPDTPLVARQALLPNMPSFATIAIGWLLSISLLVNALPHISRSGKYLYNPDGERFYIKVSFCMRVNVPVAAGANGPRVLPTNHKESSLRIAMPMPTSEPYRCSSCSPLCRFLLTRAVVVSPNPHRSSTPFPTRPTAPEISHTWSSSASTPFVYTRSTLA